MLENVTVGDMYVVGSPPPKLMKALAVIADNLHPEFLRLPNIKAGISRESCVMCSLTVQEFMNRIGYRAACVASVACVMRATRGEAELHSLGMGAPQDQRQNTDKRWIGHM